MELTKKKTNRYNNYDDISGSNDEVIKSLMVIRECIINNLFVLFSQKDNEAIRSEDQNDDSLFGTNGRLYKGLQGGDSNLINRATTCHLVLITLLTSLSFSVILSKRLSTIL